MTENVAKKSTTDKVYKLNINAKNPQSQRTIKDCKQNFQTNPSFGLINLTITNIAKISKTMLDKIIKKLVSTIHVNQWKNSSSVIMWFKNIQSKFNCSFIVFDINNFYQSITLSLFNNAFQFPKGVCNISNNKGKNKTIYVYSISKSFLDIIHHQFQ